MWFGKSIMTKLGLVLAMAVPALSAEDVAPFTFANATSDTERDDFWDELMSFKMWGTNSILMARAKTPDTLGAIGTTGHLVLVNDGHDLGGPIFVGGSIRDTSTTGVMCSWAINNSFINASDNYCGDKNTGNDSIYKGPVRVNGDFIAGVNGNKFFGKYCVAGSANDPVRSGLRDNALLCDKDRCTNGVSADCATSAVKAVPMKLTVPTYSSLPADVIESAGIDVPGGGTRIIHVPDIKNGKKMYDFHIKGSISFTNDGYLYVYMRKNSLARFFIDGSIYATSASHIQVVFVDDGAYFEDGSWKNITKLTYVANMDYVGNLLFYCNDPLVWNMSSNGDAFFQGTFMSKEYIAVKSNLTLAGQFIASNLIIGNEFNGKSFRYVQFNQPVVKLPTASDKGIIIYEGNTTPDNIEIVLDKASKTGVTFEYCFEFTGTNTKGEDEASCQDVGNGKDCASNTVPWYNASTGKCVNPGHSGFDANKTTLNTAITLQAYDDEDLEKDLEHFRIRIVNLDGAVLEDGEHDGFLDLHVKDDDARPLGKDITVAGTEDVPYKFDAFTVTNSKGTVTYSDYSVKIETMPSKGSLVIVDKDGKDSVVLKKDSVIPSSVIDGTSGKFVYKFVKDDYTEATQTDAHRYDFEFRVLDDQKNVSDEVYTALVTVAPVNDAPEAKNTEFTVPENTVSTAATPVYTTGSIGATDVDDAVLTYKFDDNFTTTYTESNYNHVTSLYGIDPATGKIYVLPGAKLNYESTDSVLKIPVVITDQSASTGNSADILSTTVVATIRLIDVNEKPGVDDFTFAIPEKSVKDYPVGEVVAKDPDTKNVAKFGHLEYSIVTADVPFAISDKSSGSITVADPTKLDYETVADHKFEFDVKVRNCEQASNGSWTLNCLDTISHVTVVLTDVNEPPVIECMPGEANCNESDVLEDSDVNTSVHEFVVKDVDKDQYKTFKAELTYADGTPLSLFKALVVPTTTVGTSTLTIVVNGPIDYETMDTTYEVKVVVMDEGGKTVDLVHTIHIKDVNETPSIDSLGRENDGYKGTADRDPFTLYPRENLKNDDPIGVVYASDPDIFNEEFRHLTYSIVEDPTSPVPFTMVGNEILVADETKMNHENGVDYTFTVKVENCVKNASTGKYTENCKDTTQVVKVKIQNVPEGPEINCKVDANGIVDPNCKGPYYIAENSKKGSLIHDFIVTDPDVGQIATMSASLVDKKTGGIAGTLFDAVMKGDTLQIVLKDSSKLNYELIDPSYTVIVTVEDADGLKDTIIRVINVLDINEAPVIAGKDTVITIPENLANGDTAGKIPASDPDIKHVYEYGHLEYSILTPNVPFEMDSNRIMVTNADTLDYESLKPDTVFTFKVQVANCALDTASGKYTGACLYDTAMVSLAVTDVPEKTIIITDCKGDSCVDDCTGPDCHDIVDSLCKGPNCTGVHTHDSVLTLAVNENVPTGYKIINYVVSDEDVGTGHKDTLVATFKNTNNSGADSLFKIDMQKVGGKWRVVVSVKDGSKLDYEKVKDIHELTIYVKDPEDPAGMGDSIRRIIEVVDVNEAPKAKDADLKPEENLPKGTVIGKLDVSEPDSKHVKEFGHLEYSIIGKDDSFVFVMDSNKVLVNDPSKMDYELAVHKYTFDVQIANCELNSTSGKYDGACLYDTAKVTVDIQDVNEVPKIIVDGPIPDGHDDSDSLCIAYCDTTSRGVTASDTLTIGVKENTEDSLLTKSGTVLFKYTVVDEDTGHVAGAKVKWVDVSTSIPSVTTKGSDLFNIEYKNGVITGTVKDQKLLDYEKLRNASSRNDPDPEYTMAIIVTDPDGLADTLYRTIRIVDVNEKPLFEVWPLVITENSKVPDTLGHVEHPSDIDSLSRNPALYDNYPKMTGGNIDLFDIVQDPNDLMRILLVTDSVLDCENGKYVCGKDSAYWVILTYGDTTLNTIYTDKRVPVKLVDLNEPPEILTDTIGVDENSPKGTVVDTIKWDDVDRFDSVMNFKIVEDPSGCFDIGKTSGVVTVKKDKCAGLDYEKNETITIRVAITDMVNITDRSLIKGDPITITKEIKVNIHDVNEPPSITDKTIAVPESTTVWTVIDTVKATDPDKDPKKRDLTYTIVDGDSTVFMIDPKKGIVILKDTLDYESKKDYVIYVQVDDGEFADTAKVKINVTNVIEQSEVIITKYTNEDTTWNYPDTVYTNKKEGVLTWRQDGEIVSADTTLKKGKNVIVITYKDPSKDLPGKDTVVIMFNDEIPLVEVSANPTHVKAENVFTIVENTGDADTNIYVNKERDSVYVHVKDPANKRDTSFALEVNLEPVEVSDATLKKMNTIADSKIMLDETPSSGVTRTAVNSDTEKRSYVQMIGGDSVTVSYMVTTDGEPIKVPVINSKGKEESVEVITVTYKTKVGDQEVEISYIADAMTGEILAKGPNGELMVQGASSKNSSKSDKDNKESKNSNVSEGIFTVTTVKIDQLGSPMVVSYAVDEKGNMVKNAEGDIGYSVTYSYKNIYGNVATESVFIVLDQTFPTVEILSPITYSIVRSNFVEVKWTVNGIEQDSLTIQGLEKGPNIIVRFYRDKAGNEASDTVSVMMKDSKNVNIAVEQPVTEIDKDKVEEYYSVNPPKKGETFAVSIKNPSTGKEVETLIGGSFKAKEGSGKEPYPGMEDSHLGPTLALDIKLPVIVPKEGYGTVSGLATLDDIVVSDGMIPLEGVDADNATKISVEEYVEKFCEDGVKIPSDISQFNLYDSKLHAKIWVYTSLGSFVDYFNFTQDLNDPSFTDEAGVLNLYFEQKPDKNGFVKADNGKQYATGAYVYKVEATIRSKLRCTLPSADFDAKEYKKSGDGFGPSAKRKGDVIKNNDELLKSFGYRRPKH